MNYNVGENNPMFGVDRSGEKAPWYGKHHSEETKRKMRLSYKGKKFTKAHRQKISKAKKGIPTKNQFKKGHTPTAGCFKSGKANPLFGKRGSEVPNWKGGFIRLPYSADWTETLRKSIRQRDNYICQLCNRTQKQNRRKLDVHHINYDKENCNPKNLISLCRNCNVKVNGERSSWTKFFKSKLRVCKRNIS